VKSGPILRGVASGLASVPMWVDPYGDDLEDLSVLRFVKTAWLRSNRILATRFPGEVSPELEEQLERQKKASLGEPWQSSLRE